MKMKLDMRHDLCCWCTFNWKNDDGADDDDNDNDDGECTKLGIEMLMLLGLSART